MTTCAEDTTGHLQTSASQHLDINNVCGFCHVLWAHFMTFYDSGWSMWSQDPSWILLQHLTYTGSSSAVVLLSRTPLPEDGQILCPKVCCFTFQSTQTLALTQKSSSKPANLFAFDAPSFHPIYATTCLLGFFQHTIIEGRSLTVPLCSSSIHQHFHVMLASCVSGHVTQWLRSAC